MSHEGQQKEQTKPDTRVPRDAMVMDATEDASVSLSDIDTLKTLTNTHTIEIAGGDLVDHIRDEESTRELLGKRGGVQYSSIIFALVQIRLPEDKAKHDWEELLKHKYTVSEALGRNVGIHVAALDYFTNIKRRVLNPKILDANEYADTASQAIMDELTHAYNRRFFDDELQRLFASARVTSKAFSLLMLDLDHFKAYNDTNGHIKGDIALIQTVRILHAVCGSTATVCRYGGEEFVVLLPDTTPEEATRTAHSIRKAVYEYRYVNEQDQPGGRLTVSTGVASYRRDMIEASEVLDEADVALYRAKNAGRDRVTVFLKGDSGGSSGS